MSKKWQYYLLFLCTALAISLLLHPQSAFAHRMIIEHNEDDAIHVRYDDGTSAGVAHVTAYDINSSVLFELEVDEDGHITYDETLEVHRIVADDSMGHRATWTDEEESVLENIPLFVRAVFGISILVFIAAIFFMRSNRKPKKGE